MLTPRQRRSSCGPNAWPTLIVRLVLFSSLGLCCGCSSTSKADNPVVGPRPPRISGRSEELLAQLDRDGNRYSDSSDNVAVNNTGIVPVTGEADSNLSVNNAFLEETAARGESSIQPADIAARVNGRPIFVSEVLEPYQGFFATQGQQLSESDLNQARRQILEKDLDQYIEQAVILDAARAQFKQDQWEELQIRLDEIFYDDEVVNLQGKLKVSSLRDVEVKMQEMGSSLAAYRRVWGERQVAGQWISEKIPSVTVSRQELLDEYQSRIEDYREPEQVKWQQCVISNAESGGRDGATRRVQKAIEDLKAGRGFDEIIENHSDPGGGPRDWTLTSSLADEQLRNTLVSLKINQIGPVLEDDRGFKLVKLLGYRPEQVKPFEEVQLELRESISQQKRSEAAQNVINELKAKAHVETIFDRQQAAL